nr:hypothetical protein [candidate division Zixibacteria bacterium]NIT52668.1 hypothetical protein [candidate division Zixibacteria bacterium]NIX79624.1 hypothetical protein [candidate division Zixibacteria bacterium]
LRKENKRMLDKLNALNDIRKKVRTVQSKVDRAVTDSDKGGSQRRS